MSKLKQLASDTVVYGISTVFSRFLNYLLVPFYTKYFAPEIYGVIGLVYGAMIFLNVLFTFGMESTYLRYGADKEQRKETFQNIHALISVVAIAFFILLWLFGDVLKPILSLSEDPHHIFELMLGIILLDTLAVIPFADLRLDRKTYSFAAIRIINVIINLSLNIYFIVYLNWGIEAVLISNIIASAFSMIATNLLTFKGFRSGLNKQILQKYLRFGLPYIPAGIGYAINEVIDRFMIGTLNMQQIQSIYGKEISTETLIGFYNASYKLAIFMTLFIQMFRMAWQPFYMSHKDDEGIQKIFRQSFMALNGLAAIIVLVIGFFREEIAAIQVPLLNATIIGEAYWFGLSIVPFLLIAYWFQLWYTHFTAGIVLSEKTSTLPKATILGAVVTVVSNFILLPILGINGAALATLLSYFSMAMFMLFQTERAFNVNYPWKWSGALILIVGFFLINDVYHFLF